MANYDYTNRRNIDIYKVYGDKARLKCTLCDFTIPSENLIHHKGDKAICPYCAKKLEQLLGVDLLFIINKVHREDEWWENCPMQPCETCSNDNCTRYYTHSTW